ncbi:hypothetical protein V6N11_007832 [Hibiscus sabdariffa]|uniref:Uncharacterized protein n=1 Tax=Hibiscus sabdariffa TaxID=183260 RepID=A0ABR2PYR7_9ROSI
MKSSSFFNTRMLADNLYLRLAVSFLDPNILGLKEKMREFQFEFVKINSLAARRKGEDFHYDFRSQKVIEEPRRRQRQ